MYNRLIRSRNEADNAAGTVDVQLKQRCDLIPNVVATVRGYMDHERGVLEKLTALREQASGAGVSIEQRAALDGQMAGLLRGLMARVEAYPQLKASEPVLQLQRSLNEVEAQIAAARRTYNAAATAHNIVVETVPTNLLAGIFGFGRRTPLRGHRRRPQRSAGCRIDVKTDDPFASRPSTSRRSGPVSRTSRGCGVSSGASSSRPASLSASLRWHMGQRVHRRIPRPWLGNDGRLDQLPGPGRRHRVRSHPIFLSGLHAHLRTTRPGSSERSCRRFSRLFVRLRPTSRSNRSLRTSSTRRLSSTLAAPSGATIVCGGKSVTHRSKPREVRRVYSTGSGKNSTTHVVFEGLFFHLDFNKALNGTTLVQPESARSPDWRSIRISARVAGESRIRAGIQGLRHQRRRSALHPDAGDDGAAACRCGGGQSTLCFSASRTTGRISACITAGRCSSPHREHDVSGGARGDGRPFCIGRVRHSRTGPEHTHLDQGRRRLASAAAGRAATLAPDGCADVGNLTEGGLLQVARSLGASIGDDDDASPAPRPENSRIQVRHDGGSTTITYGLPISFFVILAISGACAVVLVSALHALGWTVGLIRWASSSRGSRASPRCDGLVASSRCRSPSAPSSSAVFSRSGGPRVYAGRGRDETPSTFIADCARSRGGTTVRFTVASCASKKRSMSASRARRV